MKLYLKRFASFETLSLLLLLILSLLLRFVNYQNRWGLAYDQARDTIVVNEALARLTFPLIGPFSASGPFVFGPHWYWFYMLVVAITPDWMMVPWFFQGVASSFMVFVAYFIGKQIEGKKLGYLFAFFTAISTAFIAQSQTLSYSTLAGFCSFFLLFFITSYSYKSSLKVLFLIGVLIGLSINIHFQAVGMLALIPLVLVINKISFRKILVLLFGLLLPFTPIIIFDFISDHFQSRNLFEYFVLQKGAPSLPKRWLTFGFETMPNMWAHIIGGQILVAYLIGIGLVGTLFFSVKKGNIPKVILLILVYLAINFVALRYFKGSVFDAFLSYLHPVILLATAWFVLKSIQFNKIIGIGILLIITSFTLYKDYLEIKNATNFTAQKIEMFMEDLNTKHPDKKFAVYDLRHKYGQYSLSLVMYLQADNLIDDNGYRIGVYPATTSADLNISDFEAISGNVNEIQLYDLHSSTSAELSKREWSFVNPSATYDSVVDWYKK